MLQLAINHKENLNKAYQKAIHIDSNKFYESGQWNQHEIKIDDSDYYNLQYVSVDSKNNVMGYFSASICRNSDIITNIQVIKFEDNTLSSLDLFRFLKQVHKMPVRKIEWNVIKGNQAEQLYDKIIKKYGGRKIGAYTDSVKLRDGKYYDKVFYEIILNN